MFGFIQFILHVAYPNASLMGTAHLEVTLNSLFSWLI